MNGESIHVLLVEDNPGDVYLIREAFREGKIQNELIVAEDGEQAMDALRARGKYDGIDAPDLVLLDLNLPKKDGREVLEEVKNDPELRDIPVIVLTTSDAEQDVWRAYELHCNCYLTKPLEMDEFLRKIRAMEQFWLTIVRLPAHRKRGDAEALHR